VEYGGAMEVTQLPDRIARKIHVDPSGCWLWTASRDRGGYGHVGWEGKVVTAHRLVYRLLVGPIPGDSPLDHLCRVRHCVNPEHLEPVTNRENSRRGANANGGKCRAGLHDWDEANVGNHVGCPECDRLRKRRWGAVKVPCPDCGQPSSRKHLSRHRRLRHGT
jgi:hypothetical protein